MQTFTLRERCFLFFEHSVGGLQMSQGTSRGKQQLHVQEVGDVSVVSFTLTKIFDEQGIQFMGDQMYQLVDDLGRRKIILDFNKVESVSCEALGKLITLHKKLEAVKGKIALCNLDERIQQLFRVTELQNVFNIYDDKECALQAM
jgi:anti-sigma B factor antagonist